MKQQKQNKKNFRHKFILFFESPILNEDPRFIELDINKFNTLKSHYLKHQRNLHVYDSKTDTFFKVHVIDVPRSSELDYLNYLIDELHLSVSLLVKSYRNKHDLV